MTVRHRIRAWLAETHGGLFELTRHFLGQLLSTELISSRDHLDRLVVAVLTVLPGIGFVLPRVYFHKYGFLRTQRPDLYLPAVRADRLFFLSMSMILIGFATVLLWQQLFPSRRDYVVLRSLPLKISDIFLARFASVLLVIGILVIDANVTISLTFPGVSAAGQSLSRYIVAHAIATVGAGFFVLFAMIAIQGVLMNLLPSRWFEAVSVFFQALLLLGLLIAVPLAINLPNLYQEISARPAWLNYLPPTWFLGIYEQILDGSDGYFRSLAVFALQASAAVIAVALAAYALSYRRYASRATVLIHSRSAPVFASWGARLREAVFPQSEQQAVAGFASATLRRSRHHKLLLVVYLGIAAAIAIDSASAFGLVHAGKFYTRDHALEMQAVLAVPFLLCMVLVYGILHVFRVPSEPRANWVFRMAGHTNAQGFLAPVSKSVTLVALAPVLLLTPFATAYALGWRVALLHTAVAAVAALLIAEYKIADWDRIPFTCSYLAGRRPFFQTASMAALFATLLTTFGTGIETLLLRRGGFAIYLALPVLVYWYAAKARTRRQQWQQTRVAFEDVPDEFLKLGLSPE